RPTAETGKEEVTAVDRQAGRSPGLRAGLDDRIHEPGVAGNTRDLGPAVVAPGTDEIHLIVPLGTVLGLEEASGAIPGQALGVSVADRVPEGPRHGVVGRDRPFDSEPQDLPCQRVRSLRQRAVPGVTRRDVEFAVGSDANPTSVVAECAGYVVQQHS